MKITKVSKKYFETEGERVYFFEPLEEEMTVNELQELMDEHEKFILEQIKNMKKERKGEEMNEIKFSGDRVVCIVCGNDFSMKTSIWYAEGICSLKCYNEDGGK